MQKTYEKQLNRFTAIILIIVLTMADLITIGANFASLAIDMVATSSNNVEFTAYFKDENGEKITQTEAPLNAEKLNMYVDISVLREGYFNGKIALENSNFNIISITENSFVKKQEGNEVELNQINNGKTVTLEMQIQANTSTSMKAEMLNKETTVKLEGTYTSSKGTKIVEEKAEGTALVTVKFVTPENASSTLDAKILTNKMCETEEGTKRILQVLIRSKVENNVYPVKTSNIELSLPTNAEIVEVIARSTNATSKNITFGDNNFSFNKDKSKLQIKLENEEDENGNISFEQNAKDEFVVTCVYDEDKEFKNIEELQKQIGQTGSNTQITEEDLKEGQVAITQEFLTYDNKTLKAEQKINITEETYGLINYELIKQESEIYKGKIYLREERKYNLNVRSYVNSTKVKNNIAFRLDETSYLAGETKKQSKITYKEIRVRKEEFTKVLGDNGYINIATKEGIVISSITNETQANENGIIVVNLPEDTYELTIQTNKVVSTGKIDFMVTKSIIEAEYTQDEIKKLTGIENTVTEINMTEKEVKITSNTTLKETDTNINLEVSTNKISAGKATNVEIKTTLITKNESDDLYKNPTVKIYFPETIEKVAPKYKLLYGNGLEIKEQGTVKEENGRQVLEIKLEGEQSKYPGEAIDGTVIVVNADMEVDKLQTSKIDYVDVAVTNENAKTEDKERKQSKKIAIIQEQSMIVTNNIKELGVETVGKEDDEEVTIKFEEGLAKETVEIGVISNEKDTVNDVKILGKFPTKNGVNTMDIALTSGIKVTSGQKDVKVYYSVKENPTADLENKENGWTEDSSLDGKNSYLIVVPTLKNAEKIEAEYNISISQEFNKDKTSAESFKVIYKDKSNGDVKLESTKLVLKSQINKDLNIQISCETEEALIKGYLYYYYINLENTSDKALENIEIIIECNDVFKNRNYTLNIDKLEANENKVCRIANTVKSDDINENEAIIKVESVNIETKETVKYTANTLKQEMKTFNIETSIDLKFPVSRTIYYDRELITYEIKITNKGKYDIENLVINDKLYKRLNIDYLKINGEEANYLVLNDDDDENYYKVKIETATSLVPNDTLTLELIVVVDSKDINTLTSISNVASFYDYNEYVGKTDEKLINIIYSEDLLTENDDEIKNNIISNDNKDKTEKDTINDEEFYKITGNVWLDEKNSADKSESNKNIEGVNIYLLNLTTGEIIKDNTNVNITAQSNSKGEYTLANIPNGKYIVAFEYDINAYTPTEYKKQGVDESNNSDAIEKEMMINGDEKNIAVTDIIEVKSDINDIDLGLIERKKSELEFKKEISKITVTTRRETRTYEYNNTTLAKVEIAPKEINGANIRIEYTIKIKNNGNMAGYAKNIVDYLPEELNFDSSINNNWYSENGYIYNDSLKNEEIKPGASKEIELVLIKEMTDSNTGLISNIAKIDERDNMGQADVIIGVKTGKVIKNTMFLVLLCVLCGGIIYLKKKRI